MILEDSSSNSSEDNVVFGMNGLCDDGRKGLEDDCMNGLGDDGLRDDAVNPTVVDVKVITDDSEDNSDSDGFISGEKVVDNVDVLIPKSKIMFRFLLFKIFLKHEDLIQHIDVCKNCGIFEPYNRIDRH